MNIKPLAFESMGTRGMATSVVTRDRILLIDPGVNLASRRYGLPPHPMEEERRWDHWAKIKDYAEHSDILILTHYHFDHFNPEAPEIFRDKTVLLKNPKNKVNRSQRVRAQQFLRKLKGLPKKILVADNGEFTFGETRVRFSPPHSHGESPKLGYVVQVCVQEGDQRFLHTSDVQGPATEEQVDFVVKQNAQVVFCDGPVTYMLGRRYSAGSLRRAIGYLREIVMKTEIQKLILDHHLLRELNWKSRLKEVFSAAKERGVKVMTAAEFAGIRDDLLEARRRRLYGR